MIGVWCNGNTADSGPAFPGSSPGTPTNIKQSIPWIDCFFLFLSADFGSADISGWYDGKRGLLISCILSSFASWNQ